MGCDGMVAWLFTCWEVEGMGGKAREKGGYVGAEVSAWGYCIARDEVTCDKVRWDGSCLALLGDRWTALSLALGERSYLRCASVVDFWLRCERSS